MTTTWMRIATVVVAMGLGACTAPKPVERPGRTQAAATPIAAKEPLPVTAACSSARCEASCAMLPSGLGQRSSCLQRCAQSAQQCEVARQPPPKVDTRTVLNNANIGTSASLSAGVAGDMARVQGLHSTLTWACYARFRPDAEWVREVLLQSQPSDASRGIIEVAPERYRDLIRVDPSTGPFFTGVDLVGLQAQQRLRRGQISQQDYERMTAPRRDDVEAWRKHSLQYASTLVSMPGADDRAYRTALAVLQRVEQRTPAAFRDDQAACLRVFLANKMTDTEPDRIRAEYRQVMDEGIAAGGWTSTCHIAVAMARDALSEGRLADARQLIDRLPRRPVGMQAGYARPEEAYRDFGCKVADWMRGNLLLYGVGGPTDQAGAMEASAVAAT